MLVYSRLERWAVPQQRRLSAWGQGEDRGTHRPPDHLSPGEEIAFDGAALCLPHGLWAQRETRLRDPPAQPLSRPRLEEKGFLRDNCCWEMPGEQGVPGEFSMPSAPDGMFPAMSKLDGPRSGREESNFGQDLRNLWVSEALRGTLGSELRGSQR